jgi:hypothetical protein
MASGQYKGEALWPPDCEPILGVYENRPACPTLFSFGKASLEILSTARLQ